MNADKHFQKGERFERSQMKLDPVEDSEVVIEGCYMAAHDYLLAGAASPIRRATRTAKMPDY